MHLKILLSFLILLLSPLFYAHGEDASLEELRLSLKASLHKETALFQDLQAEYALEQKNQAAFLSEIRAYRILGASQRNLLLSPQTRLSDLERARADQQRILNALDTQLQSLQREKERLANLSLQIKNRRSIFLEQRDALDVEAPLNPMAHGAAENIRAILDLLEKKSEMIREMDEMNAKREQDITEVRQDMLALAQIFQQTLRERRAAELFQRQDGFRSLLDPSTPLALLVQIRDHALRLLQPSFWLAETAPLLEVPPPVFFRFFLAGLLLFPLTLKARSFLRGWEKAYPPGWRCVLLETLHNALPYFIVAVLLEVLTSSQPALGEAAFFRTLAMLLWFLAVYRMIMAFIGACRKEGCPGPSGEVLLFLLRITRISGFFVPLLLVSIWIFPADSPVLFIERLVMEISVLVLVYRFWSRSDYGKDRTSLTRTGLHVISKIIATGAPALEFFGYGNLALLWFWGWFVTFTTTGAFLIFCAAVREWTPPDAPLSPENEDKEIIRSRSLRRLGIQSLPFAAAPFGIMFIARGWGVEDSLLFYLSAILKYPLVFGSMEFSLLRLIQAFSVLLLTYLVTRLSRSFIENRILKASGMDQGLKASILTLEGYVIWGIGILSALNVFGLNTTALTVAFGALGVGLGFGLQAIFNNFVSGIILLFERPIQVGDVIEIDGIWAKVTRINVRSTVVQTFDNASLIIPNADFISARLTNWSFNDLRIRKNIDVGVSYGSDVKKVEKILLEIAGNTKHVLVHPQPDVHFLDFGDSALIFRLRFWSTIDNFRAVETQIRFKITDDFRKEGIEIPFPQRDLHIRSDFRDLKNPSEKITEI
ncbi:small-conductance mechanosensitive channel [Desulfobotulus alkaliphilus]|uniref:Small-conductance mechanosensitive channel n=1 Tax=Desulfobotulus alkaliphilus TaxID=622671 RepID=A0A562S4M2_9BACT|nr:mechanosensitive ion channel domain-containing protein [Desulfobotulus alkaliphilus]TWI75650.1 small-conductance mechanosensitive channel [Desulfobotulus alkaliphilus]